jgi:uncharacterized membrane protein (DUF4010 family)
VAGNVIAAATPPLYPALLLGAATACGLMIGIERGWQLRGQPAGSRVAGIRTFTLLGMGGGLAAVLGQMLSPWLAVMLAGALAAGLVIGFWRDRDRRDATSFVAAMLALALGLLAGAGQPALAVATGAVITFVLTMRAELHRLLRHLNSTDVHAFARYAVIAAAVLPFLPNRRLGPLDAWNPFQLWLVIVLVTGFSFAGYVANRTVGARRGVLATAIIGGAYSSTAVTASLAQRLGRGEQGPLNAGIALASAVMYLRVLVLVAALTPSTFAAALLLIGPAGAVALAVALVSWLRAGPAVASEGEVPGNPIALLPAFGFVAIVAGAAVLAAWAQAKFGETGVATSLFLTGSFDVDAAIVTLSGLPLSAIPRGLAALALGGTIVINMVVKMVVNSLTARRAGLPATVMLAASTTVLLAGLIWQALRLGLI